MAMSRKHKALLIAFANGREYGLGARIAPGARLDDGLLDAIIVEDPAWSRDSGTHATSRSAVPSSRRSVDHPASHAAPSSRRTGEMEFHVDGEPGIASKRIEVEILPERC